ncbi:MAG: glycosyltransferase [Cytophagaceae bacterium]|nr:glycosyltransferase [Cytophagaceae bacterium]|tara:strand:+ start:1651 stop:2433 length:783 start_codon:yes stop_codon:yes gene_type:complete
MPNSKKRLININISTGKYSSFIKELLEMAASGDSMYVCVANVHMLIEAQRDKAFEAIINNAYMVTPDGMPLSWSLDMIYGVKQDRVAGMDLLPDLLQASAETNLPVFFYGGSQNMLDKTEIFCKTTFPDLKIAGMYSPPFRPLTAEEEEENIYRINKSGARFVFVILGCPKQEKWMASMYGKINACMIGVGGALPVMIGIQKRAPNWMQEGSLEWFYRFMQEPKRLFKRYALTNTLFIYLVFKELANKRLNSGSNKNKKL